MHRQSLLGLVFLLSVSSAQAITISSFSPQGATSDLRDVKVTFSKPAVHFGDSQLPAPVLVQCDDPAVVGQGRWLDSRRWIYEFDERPGPGLSCTAVVSKSFRSINNEAISGPAQYRFNSGGAILESNRPYYNIIDEDQVFLFSFNAPVNTGSLIKNGYCRVEGIGERIGLKAVEGAQRDAMVRSEFYVDEVDERYQAVQCARPLPADATVSVVLEPGITTQIENRKGVPNTDRYTYDFNVRPEFTASLSCMRERAEAPCTPVGSFGVQFSAPVAYEYLSQIRLEAGKQVWEPVSDSDEAWQDRGPSQYLRFQGPFPENAKLTVKVPDGLTDDAGRSLKNPQVLSKGMSTTTYPPLVKFAVEPFGIVERFGHADREGSDDSDPPAIGLSLRNVEPDLTTEQMLVSAGQVGALAVKDDREVLAWYSRLRQLDYSWRVSAERLRDMMGGDFHITAPIDQYGQLDLRAQPLLIGKEVKKLDLPGMDQKDERPFELIGVPLKEPGFHVLEVASPRLGASLLESAGTMYVRSSVLVTNLGVHIKKGGDDLLVWVTTLDDAKVVPGAKIRVMNCRGEELVQGETDKDGMFHHPQSVDSADYCQETGLSGLFVTARIDKNNPMARGKADFSFALSEWNSGIEPWRFNVPYNWGGRDDPVAHTVMDRSLFRAGEVVHMKHYVRERVRDGFKAPNRYPEAMIVEHDGSGKRIELPLKWQKTAAGSVFALNDWKIPKDAELGVYRLRTEGENQYFNFGEFRVEQFKLPVLGGSIKLGDGQDRPYLVNPKQMQADLQLHYLSGGPADFLPVQLSAVVRTQSPSFSAYDDYSFAPPQTVEQSDASNARVFLNKQRFQLDAQGGLRAKLDDLPVVDRPSEFLLEATFADPNGEIQTLTQTVSVWPADVVAGLRAGSWLAAGSSTKLSAIAVSPDGKPLKNVPVRIEAANVQRFSIRKRMVGGFYSYDNQEQREDLGTICEGRSDDQGLVQCDVKLDKGGQVELRAIARDGEGRESVSASSVWVSGSGDMWFGGQNDDRIDVIPAKKTWAPGETAEFQVRMPFREATALVSVEREGVLQAQVVQLEGDSPNVSVEIKPEWGPNVYVSVLVLRGRLREVPWYSFFSWGWSQPLTWYKAYSEGGGEFVAPTTTVDLSKPSYRFGLASIEVSSQQDALDVKVTTDRSQYAIREQAKVDIQVLKSDGTPAAGASVALAAVDQALLELSPNNSWNLLNAMRALRGYNVQTATAQSEIVGRRHYGRKAVAAGGGGGKSPTRELLDTLLLWNGNVELDAQGRATVTVPLKDSLTQYRIVAVADLAGDRFGSGSAQIVTTQDLQIISGLPAIAREGDDYQAQVTLRNSSPRAMTVKVQAKYRGKGLPSAQLPEQTVELASGSAKVLVWPMSVPLSSGSADSHQMEWTVDAQEVQQSDVTGKAAKDSLTIKQEVLTATPITVQQGTLVAVGIDAPLNMSVQAPAGALKNEQGVVQGGLQMLFRSSLGGGMEGVRAWFERYPYSCFEQQASRFMGLRSEQAWAGLMQRMPSYMDQNGLLRYFPSNYGWGSRVLTSYILDISYIAESIGLNFSIPDGLRNEMLQGLENVVNGRIPTMQTVSRQERDIEVIRAAAVLAKYDRARVNMLDSVELNLQSWPTEILLAWVDLTQRLPGIKKAEQTRKEAMGLIQARLVSRGTRLVFGEDALNGSPWAMTSRVTNQARLMLLANEMPDWTEDMPRLAQGLLAEQQRGAWRMTTENLLGSLAIEQFSRHHEQQPSGQSMVILGSETAQVVDWDMLKPDGQGVRSAKIDVPWRGDQVDNLSVEQMGEGKAWIDVRSLAAVPVTKPISAGLSLERHIEAVAQAKPGVWSRGDIMRVKIKVKAQGQASWVVVSDPVPAGATILGSGLGRDSAMATAGEEQSGQWPSFVERRFDGYRAYYERFEEGTTEVSYTVRLNTVGQFVLPASRAEALYEPDVFAVWPNEQVLEVVDAPAK
ncbi:alpha-2-macroglobulin family protein [Alcaligenes aquatilis]|uniref:Alpha-2-macroglobulin n=1 Tax=Alcaligenes aquatilis TaxID=323284 RepID=A0A3G2HVS8_9BURK|nr:MG2 domain-containing protein [Alcaligenes aquatilis]AYN21165.1 alpha-2-macroglobulin [Alcaligenes aquatilis]